MKLNVVWRALWNWIRRGRMKSLRPGEWGERMAEAELRRARMRIVGRRVRVGRRDEVDLIGWDGDTLVFVEVKTRASEEFGRPAAAVGAAKRRHLSRAALRYVQRHFPRNPPRYIRFDVVEVVGTPNSPRLEIRHLKDVFPLQGSLRYPV